MAQLHELDLTVGDVFHIGSTTITVIDVENGEVTFRIDDPESHVEDHAISASDNSSFPLPR